MHRNGLRQIIATIAALVIVVTVIVGLADTYAAPAADPRIQTATPTPDPFAGLTITDLASRTYGGGALTIEDTLAVTADFTRYLIAYPSDGLTIYGFMNVPTRPGPFPVIVAIHGYIDPAVYGTLDYTTRYADDLARAGYLVLHPNLRGYFPSNEGPNPFRVGMAVDVLNLVALVDQQGGQPGPLEQANADAIGLWGHSMGGGISLRAITVDAGRLIDAAVLYGSMSGDERQNFTKILEWSEGARGRAELNTPDEALRRISPINYLERIQAAVSIHHGEVDELVPLDWSIDLCGRLQLLGKTVECFTYEGGYHTFSGQVEALFNQRVRTFFDRHLRQ